MTVGSTRHFESSFAIAEWLLEERANELDPHEVAAIKTYHSVLRRTSNDIWDVAPPELPQKVGSVPLHPEYDEEWYRDRQS